MILNNPTVLKISIFVSCKNNPRAHLQYVQVFIGKVSLISFKKNDLSSLCECLLSL